MLDSKELRQRLHQASIRAAQLEGVRKADHERHTELTTEVAQAKARLGLAEEVNRVFDALQQRAHERSVGAFERLLSAILNDVLPEEGKVRLIPQFKSSATWLDIALEKNGALEDVVDGNGGAVTNVVCAGLRFAALSRTDNRRLMILDEPDCWLKPERVPAFVQVVAQVAVQAQTQTFFITHHDPSFFEGQVNLVKFGSDKSGKVFAQALTPLVHQWENEEQPGIRAIELFNVRRHEHTFIPCFPGATAFIGDNNLGKSTAVVTTFKAVAYGESDDTLIRHGAEEARIIIYLENNRRVEWSRALKRSPAVIYRLWEGDKLLSEGRPKTRNQAPEWVTEVLGVARVDDLDIQVGNQKSPVFLLNDSAPRRAQILSVGRESSHLKALMKRYEDVRSADREVVKQGELALARLKMKLSYLAKLPEAAEKVEAVREQADGLMKFLETKERQEALLAKLEALTAEVRRLDKESRALELLPAVPELADEEAVQKAVTRLAKLVPVTALEAPQNLPEAPVLHDVASILTVGQKISAAVKAIAVCEQAPASIPEMPTLSDLEVLHRLTQRLSKNLVTVQAAEREVSEATAQSDKADAELKKLKEELGGECPLCGAAFPEEGLEHEHVH